jgi:hypothetical protein
MAVERMWRSGGFTYDGKEHSLYLHEQEMVYYHSIYLNRLLEYTESPYYINFCMVFFYRPRVCASPT